MPTSDVVLQETLKSVVIDNGECTVSDFPESAWPSVHADFVRLQAQVFLSKEPFTEDKGVKHVPYITVNDDGTSSILVGKVGEAIHPMNGVTDDGATDPHWITELYVTDQDGKIVAMKSLDPTGVTEATWTFETLRVQPLCKLIRGAIFMVSMLDLLWRSPQPKTLLPMLLLVNQ